MKCHLSIAIVLAFTLMSRAIAQKPMDYVDTRVGTAASVTGAAGLFGKNTEELGQTLPAVLAPNGMNFWTPQTRDTEKKCVAPYYYADSLLQGFRCSHWIVGGCTQDYGSFTLMPMTGTLRCAPQARATAFSHSDEIARPDYYRVKLPAEGLTVEMTGTSRAGIFRFTVDQDGPAYIVVNPNSDEGQGFIAVDTASNMVYGYNPVHRIYQGKGQPAGFSGHFVIVFDHKITDFGIYTGNAPVPGVAKIGNLEDIGCYVRFDADQTKPILARTACSFTSHDGALANLEAEMPDWDFDGGRRRLSQAWDQRLGSILVSSDNPDDIAKFYNAFYHASFLPHATNDVDGRYPAFATGYPIMTLPEGEHNYYDDFSAWDTYRALHPLIHLMFPTMGGEMVQSLVHKYEQGGWLPIFPCWNSYTAAMIGDHCCAIIADAYVKGIRNFNVDKAYEGMRKNAFQMPTSTEYEDGKGRRALSSYLKYGYIPLEDSVPYAYHKREQASRTLEYAYDDFATAQMATALGHDYDAALLSQRAANYANVFNPATGYPAGRFADGSFANDSPTAFSKHITEGAPCHYAWYVPHDPEGLMRIMGGKEQYVAKLDSMFSERRYWHGNEPCHQVAYMYGYADQNWKTSEAVRSIMDSEYMNAPGGLAGNDDAGQMSAWYIFASLGFYPVCPASTQYMISGPAFKSAVLKLENGNTLTLLAPTASERNIYVRGIKRNGKPYPYNYIEHDDLMQGGIWEFDMTDDHTAIDNNKN